MAFDHAKPSVMLEFNNAAGVPTVEDVKKKFALNSDDINTDAGVIPLPRDTGETYLVFVTEKAGAKVEKSSHRDFIQVWGNPKVELT